MTQRRQLLEIVFPEIVLVCNLFTKLNVGCGMRMLDASKDCPRQDFALKRIQQTHSNLFPTISVDAHGGKS